MPTILTVAPKVSESAVTDSAVKSYFEGLRVIITRPLAQAKSWRVELNRHGVAAECVPAMSIEAVQSDEEKQAVKNLILDFDNFQQAIFVSQNAVRYGLEWLDRYWPQLPEGIDYYAVGASTAQLLEADGIEVQAADKAMNSEALLQLLDGKVQARDKVIIFRGCGGRPYLGDVLEERGAQVSYAELYHRILPEKSVLELAALNLGEGDILSVHSGESLQNLLQLLQSAKVKCWAKLPLLVPSERVAGMAAKWGFQTIIGAENASDDSMYQALKRWCKRREIKRQNSEAVFSNSADLK